MNLLGTSCQSVQVLAKSTLAGALSLVPSMGHSAWCVRDEPAAEGPVRRLRVFDARQRARHSELCRGGSPRRAGDEHASLVSPPQMVTDRILFRTSSVFWVPSDQPSLGLGARPWHFRTWDT